MDNKTLPRVYIADRSPAVIERLAAAIDDVAQVTGYATSAREAIIGIRDANPQLTVLDIALNHGLDLLRQVKRHRPPVIVIVFTHSTEDTTRHYCERLGAEYFLDKLTEFDKVRQIVIALGSGRRVIGVVPPTQH